MRRLLAAAIFVLMLIPALSFAQDAQKFSAYQTKLTGKVAPLPVFVPAAKGKKAGVVDNEVITTFNKSKEQYQAVYVVRSSLEEVRDFYKSKLGFEPKQMGSEVLSDLVYIFKVPLKEGDEYVLEVQVKPLSETKNVQITLMRRAATALDPRVETF